MKILLIAAAWIVGVFGSLLVIGAGTHLVLELFK